MAGSSRSLVETRAVSWHRGLSFYRGPKDGAQADEKAVGWCRMVTRASA